MAPVLQLRDQLLETETVEARPSSIWGPCLHAGRCPLAAGRDWCHFSVPVEVPGRWFKYFSRGLSSERQWMKFTYLWLAAPGSPARTLSSGIRRVISDPLGGLQQPRGAQAPVNAAATMAASLLQRCLLGQSEFEPLTNDIYVLGR